MQDQSRVIRILSSLLMLTFGGIAAASQGVWQSTAGAVLVAVGSALLTQSVADIRNLEKAKLLLAPHLEPVCDQFLDAISQLRQATKDFRDGTIRDDTAGELIAAHSSSLESALRNLHAYSGAKSDRKRIEKSRQETHIDPEEPARHGGSTTVASRTSSHEADRVSENVSCPNCRTSQDVSVGLNVGDSALATCPSCQLRYHVHRDRYGDAFTKPWGSGSGRQFDFWCPSCNEHHFRFKVVGELQPRYCTKCGAYVMPTDDGGEVIRAACPPAAGIARPEIEENGRVVVDCECGNRCVSFYRDDEALYAACRKCNQLVRAPNAADEDLGDQLEQAASR